MYDGDEDIDVEDVDPMSQRRRRGSTFSAAWNSGQVEDTDHNDNDEKSPSSQHQDDVDVNNNDNNNVDMEGKTFEGSEYGEMRRSVASKALTQRDLTVYEYIQQAYALIDKIKETKKEDEIAKLSSDAAELFVLAQRSEPDDKYVFHLLVLLVCGGCRV